MKSWRAHLSKLKMIMNKRANNNFLIFDQILHPKIGKENLGNKGKYTFKKSMFMLIFNLEICNFSLCILMGQEILMGRERLLTLNYSKCAQFSLCLRVATLITGHVFPLRVKNMLWRANFKNNSISKSARNTK